MTQEYKPGAGEHPITPPPPHLLKKFSAQAQDETKKRNGAGYLKTFATLCIEWAMNKPPSLKSQAMDALHGIHDQGPTGEQILIIRRALEQLPDIL